MYYEVLGKLEENTETKWPISDKYISARKIPGEKEISIPVMRDNHLIVGTTRYGKTTVTKKVLDASISSGEEDFIVFFEIKDDYREYIRPEDKVITYLESEWESSYNLFKWNLVKECRQARDSESVLEAIADILFADLLEDGKNRFFAEGAKNIFKGYIKTILYCYRNCPSNKQLIAGMKGMSYQQIIEHLMKYRPNKNIVRDYFEYDERKAEAYKIQKKTGDLMAFLSNVLERFSGTFCSEDGEDTIHNYLQDNYGRRLFLIYDYSKKASSNMFFRFFYKELLKNVWHKMQMCQDI